ncbi:MAG: Hsp70 family protein [Candidatus Sericytochromatia bacterium]|nr:Hsp70 family protein [Candidatus Sericytochromatia bacterium]
MSLAIGIDLGTTNSVGAFKFASLEVVTAPDNAPPERVLTRSAVAYTPEGARVGQEAMAQLVAAPERVVVSVKRIVGRGHAEPAVQDYLKRFGHLKVEAPEGGTDQGLAIRMGNQCLAPEDVSAAILAKVLANAQTYLANAGRPGVAISRAVVTVPAYFNDKQRHATRIAGTRAGLQQVELLPEPTAAAISYAHDAGDALTILVYDFGGGTFDASLITAAENTFIESAKAGDLWLGGNDVDLALEAHVLQVVAREEGVADIQRLITRLPEGHRRRFTADLRQAVEQAKIALSGVERTMVSPATPLLDESGMQILIEVPLTRADLETHIASLVDRTVVICQQMLTEANFPLEALDRVLLVGGSAQIPLVQKRMRAAFGDRVVVHPRPMTAVAEGAAIVAAGLVEKVGTVSRDYFIRLIDNPRHCVVARNEVLPVRSSHTFVTVADGQRLLHLRFFNHDHVAGLDEPIGDMWLGLDKAYPKGTEVLALFDLDETCSVLQITASLKHNPAVKVSRTFSRGKADEAIYQELDGLLKQLGDGSFTQVGVERGLDIAVDVVQRANQVVDERTDQVRPEALAASQGAVKKLRQFVSPTINEAELARNMLRRLLSFAEDMLPAPTRKQADDLIERFEVALEEADEPALKRLTEETERLLEGLPPEVRLVWAALESCRHASQVNPQQAAAYHRQLEELRDAVRQGRGDEALRLFKVLSEAAGNAREDDTQVITDIGRAR